MDGVAPRTTVHAEKVPASKLETKANAFCVAGDEFPSLNESCFTWARFASLPTAEDEVDGRKRIRTKHVKKIVAGCLLGSIDWNGEIYLAVKKVDF